MKYLIAILSVFILGYLFKQPKAEPVKNPACLDGYLVDSLDNDHVRLFCEHAWTTASGVIGTDCYGFYSASPEAKGSVFLINAAIFETTCYSIIPP